MSNLLSQLSGICTGISCMAAISSDWNIFITTTILALIFLLWSIREQNRGN